MRPVSVLLIGVILMASVFSAGAQERETIQINHLEVPAGTDQLQTVSGVVTDTIAFSLRLMGEYSVVYPGDGADTGRSVGGRCYRDDDGSIRFHLYVTDSTGVDAFFETEHLAESLFDVFDAADQAVLSLLEGLNRRTVRFGTLRVRGAGGGLPYALQLNGEEIEENRQGAYENGRIVEGTYDLAVIQTRLVGPLEIHRESVTIRSDQPVEVVLPPPQVLSAEVEWLRDQGVGRWRGSDGSVSTRRSDNVSALRQERAEAGFLPPDGPLRRFIDHAVTIQERIGRIDAGGAEEVSGNIDTELYRLAGVSRDGMDSAFSRVFPGTVERFVREHVTQVERFWQPHLAVHVGPEEVLLGLSLNGIVGADRVRVHGPKDSGIRDHMLRDGGSISPYGNGVYDDFLVKPSRIDVGDRYQFVVERMGTTTVVETEVRPYATEIASVVDISSNPDGYLVEWVNVTPASIHTIIVSGSEEMMPAPGAWLWSTDIAGDTTAFMIPREALGLPGERRVHLFSADGNGNRVWTNRRFYHGSYSWSIVDIPERTITTDGDRTDWAGITPVASSGSNGAPQRVSGPYVEELYMAADEANLYWAISTVEKNPARFIPQIQIYNSFNEQGRHNGALLAVVSQGRTADLLFDSWNNPNSPRRFSRGVSAGSSDSFLEMSIPREYIDLEEFEMNLVVKDRPDGEFSRPVDNFFVRLP